MLRRPTAGVLWGPVRPDVLSSPYLGPLLEPVVEKARQVIAVRMPVKVAPRLAAVVRRPVAMVRQPVTVVRWPAVMVVRPVTVTVLR